MELSLTRLMKRSMPPEGPGEKRFRRQESGETPMEPRPRAESLFSRARSPALDFHEVLFLFLENFVDLLDVLVRQLLNLRFRPVLDVLGQMLVLDQGF